MFFFAYEAKTVYLFTYKKHFTACLWHGQIYSIITLAQSKHHRGKLGLPELKLNDTLTVNLVV